MTTRKDFLRQAALFNVGLFISSFFIKAGSAGVGINDEIDTGFVRCNGMRFEGSKVSPRNLGVECIALSDIGEDILNNRTAEAEKTTGKKVKHLYRNRRKLTDNKGIDLVIAETPDH